MNTEAVRAYALGLKGTTEEFPFDESTLVFKVMGKIYLMMGLEHQPLRFNFKARPEDGLAYRESFASVSPGYHSNKRHWNTVEIDGNVPEEELKRWISNSYQLVVTGLPKYKQKELKS